MSAYFDTSAMVKRYFDEVGSADVAAAWGEQAPIFISRVGYAETVATIHRRSRAGGAATHVIEDLLREFTADWDALRVVELTSELDGLINKVVSRHLLRGFDAIHLASALCVRDALGTDLLFVSADRRLLQAAEQEGLTVAAV